MQAEATDINALLEHWRVRVQTRDGVTRVHVPPVGHLSDLPAGYRWILYPIIVATVGTIGFVASRRVGSHEDMVMNLVNAALYTGISLIVVLMAVARMQRYVIIQIDADELSLLLVRRNKAVVLASWRRKWIREVHINRSNGQLRVSFEDDDPEEILLTTSRPLNEWIAERVQDALRSQAPLDQETPGLWYASSFTPETAAPQHARQHKALLMVAFALVIAGIVAFATPLAPVGFLLWCVAAIPAGIALGTQKKEYYL